MNRSSDLFNAFIRWIIGHGNYGSDLEFHITLFSRYAKHFNLYKYIQFNTYVHQIKPASDYEETGRWDIITSPADSSTDEKVTTTFDAVMICSGHHWEYRMPSFEGMDTFKGKQIHSYNYKDHHG